MKKVSMVLTITTFFILFDKKGYEKTLFFIILIIKGDKSDNKDKRIFFRFN